jgi:outer membrane lipoprotein
MNTFLVIFLLLALPLLHGCTYAISSDVLQQADRSLTFQRLQAEPNSHPGAIVVFGGTITSIVNRKDGTLIEIAEKKLDYWGKPIRTDKSGGHFLVFSHRYLDTMLYAPGRDITVAGEVVLAEGRPPGERESPLLFLHAKELKIWPRERLGWDQPPWTDPLYNMYSPQMPSTEGHHNY